MPDGFAVFVSPFRSNASDVTASSLNIPSFVIHSILLETLGWLRSRVRDPWHFVLLAKTHYLYPASSPA
jgi:hypothetical protein